MKASILKLISALGIAILLLSTVTFGQANQTPSVTASGQPEVYFVPDVVEQFNKLALRPDALAFGLNGAPDPHIGKHFQGIVRRHGLGTPYMFLSRSGSDVDECFPCTNDPGNIYIVRMQSRDINGERMRSNRLMPDWPIAEFLPGPNGLTANTWPTPPNPRDKDVRTIHFNGQDGWPNYGHPGGMQMVGDVLVVPLSDNYTAGEPSNLMVFIDVSNPEAPKLTSKFDPLQVSDPSSDFGVGQVAVAPVLNPKGPGVRYIMLLSGKSNKDVRLYRSLPTAEDGSSDLKNENLRWEFIQGWSRDNVTDTGANSWPCCDHVYQMFNFVRQKSLNDPLFMIAAYNDSSVLTPGSGNDFLDLFEVNIDRYGNPEANILTLVKHKNVGTDSVGGGGDSSHFSGSTGVYVSPSGELIVYASEHANNGPYELLPDLEKGERTVRFGEYRHREMVRPDSPTLKPSVEVQGTFEVDEGSTLTLGARGKGPITKAWLQLFEDDGMGLTIPHGIFDEDRWLAIDYEDWSKDDYDDFTKLLWFFNDNAGSWRWFAPVGCTLHVNQHSFGDSDFPGRRKTLAGTGLVEEAADLDAVRDDADKGSMDDMISSLQFFCDDYYNATIGVAWDLDFNGTYETSGNNPVFSATELDGPDDRSVNVRAQHPTDTTPLGQSEATAVNIHVRNVAPIIGSFELVDSFGFKVGIDLPFAVTHLQYAVEASFTDPGKADTQTAQLNFGDGTISQSSEFTSFSDASGGRIGRLRQLQRYNDPGTYTIQLDVTDDDKGVTTATKPVTVVSPADVVKSVVKKIDLLLATATNRTVIRALRDARDNLAGHNNGSAHDGALDALASGDLVAALEKIGAAIEALQRAEAAGAGDLSELNNLLGFTGQSVAQGTYQDAVEAVGTPSPGQATQLQRVRQSITDGHTLLGNKQYLPAIEMFKDAVGRALSLL